MIYFGPKNASGLSELQCAYSKEFHKSSPKRISLFIDCLQVSAKYVQKKEEMLCQGSSELQTLCPEDIYEKACC